jgi:hypothetical protein
MPFKKSPVLRPKSSDVLSTADYFRKRTDVVEEICDSKIELTYKNNGVNYVAQGSHSDEYAINLSKPAVEGIPVKTALYHELSHVMHKTFITGMIKQMKKMSNDTCEDRFKSILGVEYDEDNPQHVDVRYAWMERLYDLYKIAFNIIEDQRIESLTMKVWLGTNPMFMNMRKKVGDRLTGEVTDKSKEDPTCKMLMYRFLHPEFNDSDAIKYAIDKVEGCDERGSVILWKRILKPILDDYFFGKVKEKYDNRDKKQSDQVLPEDIDTNKIESLKQQREDMHKERDELSDQMSGITKLDPTTGKPTEEYKSKRNEIDAKQDEIDELNNTIDNLESEMSVAKRNERYLGNGHSAMTQAKNELGEHDGKWCSNDTNNEASEIELEYSQALEGEEGNLSVEHELSESKKEGESQVTEIKNAINGMQVPKEPSHIHKEKRYSTNNKPEPNNSIVNGLVNILRKIKERNVITVDESGDEVDVDSYINVKQKGFGNAFESFKRDNGLPIMVTVDGSGSMGNSMSGASNISKARDLVASLFKVAEQHSEITVQCNVWSSSSGGDVAITDIKSLHDCNQISTGVDSTNGYYETPTHEAIKYSARKLKEMRGRNKMLIIITDGYPQFSKNGTHLSKNVITKLCKDAYRQAQTVTPNILCINIERRSHTAKEMLTDIFGKNYVEFNGMDEASEFVNKTLKRKFVEIFGR